MTEFEQKIKDVDSYIKENKNTTSRPILKSLYSLTHLKDDYFFSPFKKRRLKETSFSSSSSKELYNLFTSKDFIDTDYSVLEQAFQEMHNRTITESGDKPRYMVSLDYLSTEIMGYIENLSNSLHINYALLEKASQTTSIYDMINKYNVGSHLMMTILHETRHNIQNNKVLDFVLDKDMSEEDKAMNAINLMYLTLDQYHAEHDEREYGRRLGSDYRELLYEHDANYFAIKKFKENAKIDSAHTANAIIGFVDESVYLPHNSFLSYATEKEIKKEVSKRADKMNDCVDSYLDDFIENIEDCPLKEKIVQTVTDFIKKDDKNNSKLTKKLNKEIKEMVDMSRECLKMKNDENSFTM